MMLRDPHESIVRNILIFPADGGDPRISPMTFNEAGAKANPEGVYTVNVDLRGLYGQRNMYATRQKGWDITNQPEKITEGEYDLFHNASPKLPVNATMARLVGVDPKKPGKRPLWRGDVVVVKRTEWPAPIATGAGAHMDYLDVPSQAMELFSSLLIPFWYNSDEWRDFLRTEQEWNDAGLEKDQNWPMYQKLYPMLGSTKSGFDKKTYDKTARMIDRLKTTRSCSMPSASST
ncbi:hypothetical protein B0H17DRAFT_1251348 [Mycena rosella]|uniref:Uncharacterized protein n=1 Tax=Mycena rosella TaxID=1033263 RepID=A0AAD7GLL1_MYCRO|nr:hypothetical protein B0H17DRAFT_1251348 [Mycena rosella]